MKRLCFIILFGLISLIFADGSLVAGDWKETEISRNIRMNYKPNIIPPGPDVPPEIAVLSGRWEGKAEYPKAEWILIVEEVTPKKQRAFSGGVLLNRKMRAMTLQDLVRTSRQNGNRSSDSILGGYLINSKWETPQIP